MNHLEELVQHAIDGLKDRGEGVYGCDLHSILFNEDCFITLAKYKLTKMIISEKLIRI